MHMDQAIFSMKVSVEATSLYLLICSLLDDDVSPTLGNLESRWTGDGETLQRALHELARRRIVHRERISENEALLELLPTDAWIPA